MATHKVSFKIPAKVVLSKDLELEVKSDGAMLGRLLISKGMWSGYQVGMSRISID